MVAVELGIREQLADIRKEATHLLRSSANFSVLSDREADELIAVMSVRRFDKGQFIFMDGDEVHSYEIVLSGAVRLFKQSPCGKAFTITLLGKGDTLNDITVFSDVPIFVNAQAIEPTTLLSIERTRFLAFIARNPALISTIMRTIGKRVKSIIDRTVYLLADTAERRVCKVILMLNLQYGTLLSMTHQEIADLAGVTRETVTRTLCHVQALGFLRSSRSNILITDEPGLRKLCCD